MQKIFILTLTRPIGLPPHTLVAQKIAEQRWYRISAVIELADWSLIRQQIATFLYKMMWLEAG